MDVVISVYSIAVGLVYWLNKHIIYMHIFVDVPYNLSLFYYQNTKTKIEIWHLIMHIWTKPQLLLDIRHYWCTNDDKRGRELSVLFVRGAVSLILSQSRVRRSTSTFRPKETRQISECQDHTSQSTAPGLSSCLVMDVPNDSMRW